MADYRDPKVTETDDGGMGKWIGWLISGLVGLLLLAWLLGWFSGPEVAEVDEVEPVAVETVETDGVLIDEADAVETEVTDITGDVEGDEGLIELDTEVEVVEEIPNN